MVRGCLTVYSPHYDNNTHPLHDSKLDKQAGLYAETRKTRKTQHYRRGPEHITGVMTKNSLSKKRRAFNSLIIIRRSSTVGSSSRFVRVNTSPYSIDCIGTSRGIRRRLPAYALQIVQISAASATRNSKVIELSANTPARQTSKYHHCVRHVFMFVSALSLLSTA